ncbi:hypothetical protein [Arcticibacterium luteifluviistationis]|uniref:Uncharacterized protein n=1 Tax=Arcticibacterium luteifluviistationis TaxID=1784714 RepID=A0A2Z4GH90_9BACT|nr:hypothetical protein [Arcticibacterium luteifluviistationis]AWW00562.1 hypothetical protein DJ013_21190 [Arcticibacterium luteifluviistationis]
MKKEVQRGAQSNSIYGLGCIGAVIYFLTTATSFTMGVLGVLKAVVWPAYFVYEAFKSFGL